MEDRNKEMKLKKKIKKYMSFAGITTTTTTTGILVFELYFCEQDILCKKNCCHRT